MPNSNLDNSIKDFLISRKKALTISAISHELKVDRHTIAHRLELLHMSGQIEMRQMGMAKKYYVSDQVPLESFLDTSSDLVLLLDTDFRIIYANETVLN